ncbi:MAG: hypothetical protein N3F63_00155 [Thermoplasmata archaeon]|nr:hypothetical protein [Thermoplasmata archaeon]
MKPSKVLLVLAVMFFVGSVSAVGAPVIPYNQYGLAYKGGTLLPQNSAIKAWIDGVNYGNTSVNATGFYDLIVPGDNITVINGTTVNPVKEGGVDNDLIYFTYEENGSIYFANQTALYVNGSSVEKNLTFYATTQKALINEVVAEPGDGGNDYVYLYFPDIAGVSLQNWKLEKCGNGSYSAWSATLSSLTTQVYPTGSNYLYVDLGGNILSGNGGSLKLLWYSSASTTWLCIDRVEWNATVGGTHTYSPSNTVMPDATGATTSGMAIKRIGTPPVDTDDCAVDFIVTSATGRPPVIQEHVVLMLPIFPAILITVLATFRRRG